MKSRVLGIEFTPWREQLDLIQAEALTSEDGWLDEMLEALETGSGGNASAAVSVSRVPTPRLNPMRYEARKTASNENWKEEMSNSQTHVSDILSKLGNGR